jgi:hypothetical protein
MHFVPVSPMWPWTEDNPNMVPKRNRSKVGPAGAGTGGFAVGRLPGNFAYFPALHVLQTMQSRAV